MENSNVAAQACNRANRITAYFAGEGKMIATFYKTHEKLGQISSDDDRVVNGGFVMPVGVEAAPGVEPKEVTPNEKLEAFKAWVQNNSTLFGFYYDPIDRRSEGSKFPSTYDQAIFTETATKVLTSNLTEVVTSLQNTTIGSMINNGHVPADTVVSCQISEPKVSVQESYKNGNLKYANAEYTVSVIIGGKTLEIPVTIKLVSGQLQKPRNLGTYVFTPTGIKSAVIDAGLLPKIEKPKEEDCSFCEETEKKSTRKKKESNDCPTAEAVNA